MGEQVLGFTGHRPSGLPWKYDETAVDCVKLKSIIEREVTRLIWERQITRALSGMALGVDMYGAEIILKLKESFPNLQLECVIPYEAQASRWNTEQRRRYFDILQKCDKETLIQDHYSDDCYLKRNTYIAEKSDILIAVSKGTRGGTEQTKRIAAEKNKHIVIINPGTFKVREINYN